MFEFPVCVSAGRVWTVGCWRVVVGVSGQLRHPVALLPVALRRQPHHHPRHGRHGDGVPGLPGCHQGEQVPAVECECTTIPIMHHYLVHLNISFSQSVLLSVVFRLCWNFTWWRNLIVKFITSFIFFITYLNFNTGIIVLIIWKKSGPQPG